jgi:hypothetical protein
MPENSASTRSVCWRTSQLPSLALAVLLIGLSSSCQQPPQETSQVSTNLGWLGSMYGMYVGSHKGQTPNEIGDLRNFVEKRINAEDLARLKVGNVNELFVSPRDGKPFEMVTYGTLPPPVGGEPPPIVLYEASGLDGERAIALLGGGTQTVDENELQSMLPRAPGRSR